MIFKKPDAFTRENLRDTGIIGAIGIGIFVLLRVMVPISHVPSVSMEPTIEEDSKILVNNLAYRSKAPQRGDIVVFDSGYRAGLFDLEPVNFTKRIVGLPGETVEIAEGQVFISGRPLEEEYAVPAGASYPLVDVPAESYFLLGDNRDQSHDSRVLGAIAHERIRGRVIAVIWPLGELKPLETSPGR